MNLTVKLAALFVAITLAWLGLEAAGVSMPSLSPAPTPKAPSAAQGESADSLRIAANQADPAEVTRSPGTSSALPAAYPVTGRVVDDVTGEPVANFRVGVATYEPQPSGSVVPAPPADGLIATTDSEGVFVTAQSLPPGEVWVLALDFEVDFRILQEVLQRAPVLPTTFPLEHTGDGELRDVRVAVGPTYELITSFPEGLGEQDLFCSIGRFGRAQVRSGPRPWVRFPRVDPDRTNLPVLGLWSRDGRWGGEAAVQTIRGIHATPVPINLTPKGRLTGEVLDAGGSLIDDVEVHLWAGDQALEDFDWSTLAQMRVRAGDRHPGRFSYGWLEPGTYSITAQGDRWIAQQKTMQITSEEETLVFRLEEQAAALDRTLSGRVTSATGSLHRPLSFAASPVEQRVRGSHTNMLSEVVWEEVDGQWIGHFAVDGLEERAYRVRLFGEDEFGNPTRIELPVIPEYVDHRPSDGPLHFHIDDSFPAADVCVTLVDAETGAAIEEFRAVFYVPEDGGPLAHRQVFDGLAEFEGLIRPERRRGWITADGYRPLDLKPGALASEGGEHRFSMCRGWGAMVGVLGADRQFLVGALVYLDDILVGSTDADGRLIVEADHAPTHARVELEGYRLKNSQCTDPETDRILPNRRDSGDELVFFLVPEDG